MAEQRLIDSNADVYPYVETWTCNCSEYGVQKVMAVDDISTLPEIDPETIPIVRQLRAELAEATAEREAAVEGLENYMVQDVINGNAPCEICANARETPCEGCDPKWRGTQKEE